MIRFVELPGTYSNVSMFEITDGDGEHIGYFVGDEKHARAIETAVMIVQRTPLALDGTEQRQSSPDPGPPEHYERRW